MTDITDLRMAQETSAHLAQALARSNAELEQFAYVASHDLQEPLRMVTSYLQLISRRYRGQLDQNADEFIDFAVDGAKRMRALINGLLTYSRLNTQAREPAPVDCGAVLSGVKSNLSLVIEETQARIDSTALPTVMADSLQLEQLFQNLLGNALKFRSQAAPHITISAEELGEQWCFAVQDNGIGFEPQFAERIFAIFQRLHSHEKYTGTGIGLAVCKKIVERHGGQIWCQSKPGQGTTFFFTLPGCALLN
jgi:light-regulated signal transduction histidine kinase (bacteriophytochrome)